ncbi:MAG: chorismate--pyruvate lyase family protein [Candidatus Hydrothermarchaeales archaeon]
MKALEEMERELALGSVHRMLLANTGSMTALLEALFGKIRIETETQKVIEAGTEIARILDIEEGEAVNYRAVRLVGKRVLVHATSYTPLSRLEESFKEDLMRKDTPIGKILAKHNLESRREILGFGWLKAGERFAEVFDIPSDSLLLKRNYNIIHNGKPLMNITEVFPYEMVEWER